MAFIQKVTPPPNQVHQFSLKDFSGGLNNNSELLEPNQATSVMNMSFTNDTIMEKRFGIEHFNETDYNGKITFIDEFGTYTDGDKFIVATDTHLYVDDVELVEVAGTVRGATYNGKYYFVDGDKLRVYGVFPHEAGDYVGIVGEHPGEGEYAVLTLVSPPEDYTPLSDEHTRGKEVYNFDEGTIHYEPSQLELEDAYKNGNVVPSNVKYIAVYDGRLYLSGDKDDDDNIFISDVNQPYYFPVATALQPTPNSDKVKGLLVYDDGVLVGRGEDMYFISGKTNNPEIGHELFKLRKINTHTGIASDDGMCIVHNHLFFVGSDGVMYALGTTKMDERLLHTQIISRQLDLFKEPFNFTYEDLESVTSIFHEEQWYVSIRDLVLVYHYRLRGWTIYDSHDATCFARINNEVVWGNSVGRLSSYAENFLDYGEPFECKWSSKWFDMGDANAFKQFREFFLVAHTFRHINSDVRVKFEIDYVDVKNEVLIANQMSIWGVSVFGDRFITRNTNASLPFVLGRRGRQIRISLKNGYYPNDPVETEYDLQYIRELYVGYLVYVNEEETYFLYTDEGWEKQEVAQLDQRMRVYQINGEYEYRGKR